MTVVRLSNCLEEWWKSRNIASSQTERDQGDGSLVAGIDDTTNSDVRGYGNRAAKRSTINDSRLA